MMTNLITGINRSNLIRYVETLTIDKLISVSSNGKSKLVRQLVEGIRINIWLDGHIVRCSLDTDQWNKALFSYEGVEKAKKGILEDVSIGAILRLLAEDQASLIYAAAEKSKQQLDLGLRLDKSLRAGQP
jgi:hypothetical protein